MNISYVGKRPELTQDQQRKLDARWDKIAKLIEWKGQREAHVVITTERHMMNVEITVNFYDHSLVCVGSNPDYFTAATQALDKLEKQALRVRSKTRDSKRTAKDKSADGTPQTAEEPEETPPEPVVRIFPIDHHDHRKPMTLDEAIMAIDDSPYFVYRDSDKDCVTVLIRRTDGGFDLVES